MNQFLGAAQGDQEHMLGKFLYFSLANLLVDKDELSSLCESMGLSLIHISRTEGKEQIVFLALFYPEIKEDTTCLSNRRKVTCGSLRCC